MGDYMVSCLGCLNAAAIIKNSDATLLEVPIFVEGKVNKNGWKVTGKNAEMGAKSLVGKPLRLCRAVSDFEDIADEHACDIGAGDNKANLTVVKDVFMKEKDGQKIWYAHAIVPPGVDVSAIPKGSSVAMVGTSKEADGEIVNPVAKALAFTDNPAYDEAINTWYAVASTSINKPKEDATHMTGNDPAKDAQNAPPAPPAQTPEPQKFAPEPKREEKNLLTEDEFQKRMKEEREKIANETRLAIKKETAIDTLLKKQIEAEVITSDEMAARTERYNKLDIETIESMTSDVDKLLAKIAPKGGVGKPQGTDGVKLPLDKRPNQSAQINPKQSEINAMLGLKDDDYARVKAKYNL
jgi:hypothetical protein